MIPKITNISFKSIPIYDVKVKKKEGKSYKSVDAVFSKLDPHDKSDAKAFLKLYQDWTKKDSVGYTGDIFNNFFNHPDDDIYAIELKGEEPLYRRIITLADVISMPHANKSYIAFMQSKPYDMRSEKERCEHLKGGGETMLYGIIKNAKENGNKEVSLFPRSYFFEYMGFTLKPQSDGDEYLPQEKFKPFIKRVEKKYGFSNNGEKK